MTEERSKRREFLPLVFIVNCLKKPLLIPKKEAIILQASFNCCLKVRFFHSIHYDTRNFKLPLLFFIYILEIQIVTNICN